MRWTWNEGFVLGSLFGSFVTAILMSIWQVVIG